MNYIYVRQPNWLQIDADFKKDKPNNKDKQYFLGRLQRAFGAKLLHEFNISSPRSSRIHTYMVFSADIPDAAAVAFQMALGSDRNRECHNAERVAKDVPAPILFIEPFQNIRGPEVHGRLNEGTILPDASCDCTIRDVRGSCPHLDTLRITYHA